MVPDGRVLCGDGRFPASLLSTVLAVATSNLGLWIALHQAGLDLFVHPQLWLIPPALATLVAEYLHRSRLTMRSGPPSATWP